VTSSGEKGNPKKMQKMLIMGVSSWLGYLLAHEIHHRSWPVEIVCTVRSTLPSLPQGITPKRIASQEQYEALIESEKPDLIVNFLRGEEKADLRLHDRMVAYCRNTNAKYVYASSVLALDGYKGIELTEDLPAKSKSPYGIFKGECEQRIQKSGIRHLILRFASVQGWVPHKKTRNQAFLEKVSSGKTVRVDTGVMQNRFLADDLIACILDLVADDINGVIHIGTEDASSEVDFLRNQAIAFGLSPEQIVEGPLRDVNLVAKPIRLFELFGNRYRRLEADTLAALVRCPGLNQYRNPKDFHAKNECYRRYNQ
jgi:dTDP-4-dehydrorhamnose reductase